MMMDCTVAERTMEDTVAEMAPEGTVAEKTPDLEARVRAFFETWKTRDPDRLAQFFAPGASWTEPNREPAVGIEMVRAVLGVDTSFARAFEFEFLTIGTIGRSVFTERIDRFVVADRAIAMSVAGIFEFDPDGRITAWRDYYDWAHLRRELRSAGIDTASVDRR
ncbi:MAG: nuclear transport factor 2 family protein [Actinomycetota bacterium]|nr:nuclear transport factor 2 family protein [Actinomycetota bacterium]